jgi:polyhydroxybutyrate depolymerase
VGCKIDINGVQRTYTLHVPKNYKLGNPLLVGLHPSKGSPGFGSSNSALYAKSEQYGYVAVLPQAMRDAAGTTLWNACPGQANLFLAPIPDDVSFIKTLIHTTQAALGTDPKRVYVTGFSSGAEMAQTVGAKLGDIITAIAPVEFPLCGPVGTMYAAVSPVSVIILHSTKDVLKYCGLTNVSGTLPSQDQVFDYWAAVDNGTEVTAPRKLCGSFLGTQNQNVAWRHVINGRLRTEVVSYKLYGGQHLWFPTTVRMNIPSGTMSQPYNPMLNSTTGLDETDIILKFFYAHSK